jgi:ABC-type nitrate/sulfonate/bicarbonate transport system permease component
MKALGAVPPALFLCAWQLFSRLPGFPVQTFSNPADVISALLSSLSDGTLLRATGETFQATISGLSLAILFGVPFGFLVGSLPRADRLVVGVVEVLRPVPAVAVIPLALLMFGFGASMESAVVAFAAFWPVMVVARTAARSVDDRLVEVARALEFNALERFLKSLLPAALRQLFVGFRLGLGVALVVAVTVEVAVNPQGLGYAMTGAQAALRPDQVLAFLVWVGLVGWMANAVVALAEVRLFRWDTVDGARR